MDDDEGKEAVGGLSKLKVLYVALPAEAKGAVAFLIMCLLFLPTIILMAPMALEKRCWEFQAKDNRFFKFNSCNGDVIEITEEYLAKAKAQGEKQN